MKTSDFNKIVESAKRAQPKKKKLFRFRSFLWITCISALLAIGIFVLLLHKPADYSPPEAIKDNEVSKYLTHVLMRDLYNGAQLQEPFELIITQEGINDIIKRLAWPMNLDGMVILVPEVLFEPQLIILRGTVQSAGIDLLITVIGSAYTNKDGLLNLDVSSVKIGALNVTALARAFAQSIYEKEVAKQQNQTERIEDKIIKSLLKGEPFDPVFRIERNSVRIMAVDIKNGLMTMQMNSANSQSMLEVDRTPDE